MKKLFPLILVIGLILGAYLTYSVWRVSTTSPQAFFESGKKYYESKHYAEARIEFLNALRGDPRHRDSRYYLALTHLGEQDARSAVAQFKTLLEYYPDDVEANLQLGRIDLAAGLKDSDSLRQAKQIAEKVLSKEPTNVSALMLLGNSATGLQDYRSAADQFEKAIALDPQNGGAFLSMGASQLLQKSFPEAEKAFLKAHEINPKDKAALVTLGMYYVGTGDTAKAERILKAGLADYPADREIYLQLVGLYFRAMRFEDVENVLREAQTHDKDDPFPSLSIVNLYEALNRLADARKLLLELKRKFPKNVGVAIKLATNLLQDRPEEARKEIDEILKAEPTNPAGHVLLGELEFTNGKMEAAEATLGTNPALNSPYPQAHFLLGSLSARKGNIDQAREHYQKSLAVNKNYAPARVALAEIYMNQGKLGDARQELRTVLESHSRNVPARLLKTSLDVLTRDYAEAERELNAILKENPDNAAVHRQMGLYYAARGNNTAAERSLTRALELNPKSEQSFRELTLFYLKTQKEKAVKTLASVPDADKQAFHYELMGIVASQAGKLQDAENAFKKALAMDPDRATSDQLLLTQYITSGRIDDAFKMLNEREKKDPRNSGVLAMKGVLYERQGKLEEAKQHYARALQGNETLDLPANNLALLLAEEGHELDKALGLAQGVRKRHPEDPNFADTLAWVYYKLGSHVLAREAAQFAVSRQPDSGEFQYHLALIYKANGQISEAVSALKKAAASPGDFKQKALAQAALKDIERWAR